MIIRKKFLPLSLCLVSLGLVFVNTACFRNDKSANESNGANFPLKGTMDLVGTSVNNILPSTEVFPTPPPLPIFLAEDDVECSQPILENGQSYILDAAIPGHSTKDEVLKLFGSPTEEIEWGEMVTWLYKSEAYDYRITFMDSTVTGRDDPRMRLDEIVTQYGVPEQVFWRLPKFAYHVAVPRTYLLYPEQGIMFVEERQIMEFAPDTLFRGSFMVEPSQFESYINEQSILTETEADEVVMLRWPC